jgi:branched-chain amino acid aminotransferase
MKHKSVHLLNGKLVSESELRIPVRDLGFLRGYAVFDFFITYRRRPFMLEKHIERLFNSANLIGLQIPWSKEHIRNLVLKTLAANKDTEEKAIKVIISGGTSDSLMPQGKPTIIVLVDPRHMYKKEVFEKGVGVITVEHNRYSPAAKTNNYIEGVKQVQVAAKSGAIEPIYFDKRQVFEGATCNIFAVIRGRLLTPKTNILPGITRDTLLAHFRSPIPMKVADFSRTELLKASEVFLTASNKEVMPVTIIDGKKVGKGTVGPVTKEAMRQFAEFTASDRW